MGAEVDATQFTREDRKRHREKVRKGLDVLARMLTESRFDFERPMAGLEIELNLVDDDFEPAMRNAEVLAAIADPSFQTELGRFNIEINVAPRRLADGGFTSFEQSVRQALNDADPRAEAIGAQLVMIGILPTLMPDHVTLDSVSENPRYSLLDQQIFAARGEDLEIVIDGVERLQMVSDTIMPEAACTSTQVHLQVSPDDFAGYWNAAQAIAGVQVAVGANSPFLFGRAAGGRVPDPAVRAEHRHPQRGAEGPGRTPAGLVRRALDHLDLRPVRGELALLPGPAADQLRRGSGRGARRGRSAEPGRAAAAQRHRLPLEPAGLRHQRRQAPPAGGEPGAAGRPDGGRHHGQRRVLRRTGPRAGRPGPAGLDPDVVPGGERELRRRDPAGHRRRGLLAAGRSGQGRRAGRPQAAAAGRRGAAAVGGRRGRDRPAAGHHRAPLPARGQRCDVADCRGGQARGGRGVPRPRRCAACWPATWT